MSTIATVSSAPALPVFEDPAARLPQKNLGQNDFLKLLATQFKTQDPMKPVEDTAFIAQMAQFTALQQSGTMAQTMLALRADQLRATANSYLGHTVVVETPDGQFASGEVNAIDSSGDEPQLVVHGVAYPISSVLRVEPGLVPSASSPASGS